MIGQAILGALVVKYHLAPGLVMSHFILSMLLLDAAFALAWCSRYEPGERRASTDRLGVWAVRALIPLGQLTILAGTIATASGPHAGAHEGELVHRFDFEGTGTLEWVVQRHCGDRRRSSAWPRSPSGSCCAAREATGAPLGPSASSSACSPCRASSAASSGPWSSPRRSSGSTSPWPPLTWLAMLWTVAQRPAASSRRTLRRRGRARRQAVGDAVKEPALG